MIRVSADRTQITVQYHAPGAAKPGNVKLPITQAHHNSNVYVNEEVLQSAMQYKKHLGVGVPPTETPSVQNCVISREVHI